MTFFYPEAASVSPAADLANMSTPHVIKPSTIDNVDAIAILASRVNSV